MTITWVIQTSPLKQHCLVCWDATRTLRGWWHFTQLSAFIQIMNIKWSTLLVSVSLKYKGSGTGVVFLNITQSYWSHECLSVHLSCSHERYISGKEKFLQIWYKWTLGLKDEVVTFLLFLAINHISGLVGWWILETHVWCPTGDNWHFAKENTLYTFYIKIFHHINKWLLRLVM